MNEDKLMDREGAGVCLRSGPGSRHTLQTLLIAVLLAGSAPPVQAQIVPLREPFMVNEDTQGGQESPASCADERGGFAISWSDDLGPIRMRIVAQRFDASGTPVGGNLVVTDGADRVLSSAIGCLPDGALVVVWVRDVDFSGTSELLARRLAPGGGAMGPVMPISTGAGWNYRPSVACSAAGCTVVWTRSYPEDSTADVVFRRLDSSGAPVGAERLVLDAPDSNSPVGTVATGPDGSFAVVWARTYFGDVLARRYDPTGNPRGPVVEVRPAGYDSTQIETVVAALDPEGNLGVVWPEISNGGSVPIDSVFLAILGPDDRPLREPVRVDDRLFQQWNPKLILDSGGSFVVFWVSHPPFGQSELLGRVFDRRGLPLGPPARLLERLWVHPLDPSGYHASARSDGTFVLGWVERWEGSFSLEIFAALFRSGIPAAPPGPWLTSPSVGGFSFKVRISGGSGSTAGAREPSCIPETVCVSGALPGRAEVFLRVVGPKPNRRLWPTLVKFSTSMVEVWVRQEATGEVRYYRLEGARPGFDELPGLFDRVGFAPVGASSSSVLSSGLTLAEPTVLAGTEAPPPSGTFFTSPHYPDFRFRARISSGGQLQEVRQESACIEETLCLSGAIPGRSEVFLRIVGPKPNGRLWPTIVKFTTSTLEVWIDQVSTGESRYYRIEGAAPGKDDLTGLFDRAGFAP